MVSYLLVCSSFKGFSVGAFFFFFFVSSPESNFLFFILYVYTYNTDIVYNNNNTYNTARLHHILITYDTKITGKN